MLGGKRLTYFDQTNAATLGMASMISRAPRIEQDCLAVKSVKRGMAVPENQKVQCIIFEFRNNMLWHGFRSPPTMHQSNPISSHFNNSLRWQPWTSRIHIAAYCIYRDTIKTALEFSDDHISGMQNCINMRKGPVKKLSRKLNCRRKIRKMRIRDYP